MSLWRKVCVSAIACMFVFGCAGNKGDSTNTSISSYDEQSASSHYDETIIRKVYFDFDKSSIKEEGKAVLLEIVKMMQESPEKRLLIVGHADERGTEEYNIGLGERRANSAKKFIVSCDGDLKHRIKVDSKGKSEPEVIGHGEAVWSKNRRDVISLFASDEDMLDSKESPEFKHSTAQTSSSPKPVVEESTMTTAVVDEPVQDQEMGIGE